MKYMYRFKNTHTNPCTSALVDTTVVDRVIFGVDDDDYQDNPPALPQQPLIQDNLDRNGFDSQPEQQKIKTTLLNNFSKLDLSG